MRESSALRTSDVKQSNMVSILRYIRQNPMTTKPMIGEALALSRPTVNNIVDELLQSGLLTVSGMGVPGPSGGKPPQLISLSLQSAYVVGASLGRDVTSLALIDLSAKVHYRTEFPTRHEEGPESWCARLADAYREVAAAAPDEAPIFGIGVAVRGVVNSKTGILTIAVHLPEWTDVPLTEMLNRQIGVPVYAETESYSFAVAEKLFGSAAEVDNFVMILCSEAVGSGLFINGSLYYGAQGMAGEIGHFAMVDDGEVCYCGNRGCLETLVSSTALMKKVRGWLAEGQSSVLSDMETQAGKLEVSHVGQAYAQGDALAVRAVEEIGYYLGRAVAFITSCHNPSKVILCGELAELGEPLLQSIRSQVRNRALPIAAAKVEIELSPFREKMSPVAGASLVINDFFSNHLDKLLASLRQPVTR